MSWGHEEITIEWDHGPPLVGHVQMVEDYPFAGTLLLREPRRDRWRSPSPVRAIEDMESVLSELGHWESAAAKGCVYPEDAERHNPEWRRAMCRWWTSVAEWVSKEHGWET